MGLASKLAASQGQGGGGPPPGYPPVGGGGSAAAASAPPMPSGHGAPPSQPGFPPQGQYGQPGQYGAPPGQPGQFGAPPGQPAQYGQQPQFGGAPGQPGQYGAPPSAPGYPGFPGQQLPGQPGYPGQQQQQQPGAGYPPVGAPPSGGGAGPQAALANKLQSVVTANRLEYFYPPQRLQQLVSRMQAVDFKKLAQQWRMPTELAYDLAALALYDIVIFADDSGSMVFEEGGERIADLKEILGRVASVATLFDEDGILIRFMNSNVQGNGVKDALSAANVVQQVNFTGLTPLGTKLNEKVVQPFLAAYLAQRNLQKPILVIVITDGEPSGEPSNAVAQVIKQAKGMAQSSPYGPGAIAFEFAQVGKDQKAQAFLGSLDNDPEIGRMVDATSYYELEADEYSRKGITLTPELWLVKLMVGAIDPSYDEQD